MNKLVSFFWLPALLLSFSSYGQESLLEKNLKKHLSYLASDKLGGRLTGTKYEKKAGIYIEKQFKAIGLSPKGNNGTYYQSFEFASAMNYGPGNSLEVNGKKLRLDKDFYPLPYSPDADYTGQVVNASYGINAPSLNHNDYAKLKEAEGKIMLIDLSLPDGNSPHSRFAEMKSWRSRLEAARLFKPLAIIFYHSDEPLNLESFKKFNNLQREDIPMLHVSDSVAALLKSGNPQVKLSVSFERKKGQGRNVLGYIDNGKATTIIIGAHYDHLGKGEFGNSLYRGDAAVHNGADDNASGTSALIELARIIKETGPANHNYLFIAFSGEELGLLGSSRFANHPTIPLDKVDYMLNMDMVGRLDSLKRELGINGTGTSPTWDSVIYKISPATLKIKTSPSGMGPSDQSSFYLKNVPAIHFFTGTHPDYHKPSDDADKINYAGMADVVQYIHSLIKSLDNHPKLVFQKTRQDTTVKASHFKVTLGIIPDYFYDKGGLRVDGVSGGKPAEKAGVQAGDIILKLGDYQVKDMGGYMEALSKFKKGDKTQVSIKRGDKEIKLPVEF